MREKSVQILEQLFLEIVRYFLFDQRDSERERIIREGISDKLDAVVKHDLYTRYKTAKTKEQQEKARIEYLEKAGIPQPFRR